ncbi:hypothetical protein ACFPM0_27125 [Pseudonocardia sulfidoxydans]|uniref:hypothetical protein n=1 Tax=Pseudonocardia sulfidoxydans TaxID=54011 RepID=UPI00361E7C98
MSPEFEGSAHDTFTGWSWGRAGRGGSGDRACDQGWRPTLTTRRTAGTSANVSAESVRSADDTLGGGRGQRDRNVSMPAAMAVA